MREEIEAQYHEPESEWGMREEIEEQYPEPEKKRGIGARNEQ